MTLEPPTPPLVDSRPSLSSSPGKTTSKTYTTKEKKQDAHDEVGARLAASQLVGCELRER